MPDTPPLDAEAPPPTELVDTAPAPPERTGVTYGILFLVLASLLTFFALRLFRSH